MSTATRTLAALLDAYRRGHYSATGYWLTLDQTLARLANQAHRAKVHAVQAEYERATGEDLPTSEAIAMVDRGTVTLSNAA